MGLWIEPPWPRGAVTMFCGMATSTARQGEEEALVLAALDHADALRQQPGCVAAYVLTERGGRTQLSLSIFDDEESFHRGLEATRAVIAQHHLDRLLEGPSTFRVFDVRSPR